MSLTYSFDLLGKDMFVKYSYEVVSEGSKPTRDDPGSPMELEFTIISLHEDIKDEPVLEAPDWLQLAILDMLNDSDEVYQDVLEDISW